MAATPPVEMEPQVKLGAGLLIPLRGSLEHTPTVLATCENACRLLFQDALEVVGYPKEKGRSVPKDDPPASKPGKDMEGDGCTLNVSDASGVTIVDTTTIKFPDSKQVGIVVVLKLPDTAGSKTSNVVVGVAHFKSGTKSIEEEETRAMQMTTFTQLIKAKAAEHKAVAGIIAADCNASLHDVKIDAGEGEEITVPPLLLQAALAEGFNPVLPKETDGLEPGSEAWKALVWSSYKERNVGDRPENKRRRKVEIKKAGNDFVFTWFPESETETAFLDGVQVLLPTPEPCPVTGMADYATDHLMICVKFANGFSIAFQNLLARGLREEMLKYVPPCIEPDFESVAQLAVKKTPRTTYTYDIGGTSKAGAIIEAPYRLHKDQATYYNLALAMQNAWNVSVAHEARFTQKSIADVLQARARKLSRRTAAK